MVKVVDYDTFLSFCVYTVSGATMSSQLTVKLSLPCDGVKNNEID